MASSSLIRYAHRSGSGGQKLFWGRVGEDGAPFRGPTAPMMPEEEFEARTVRVADFRNGFFDTQEPEENKLFLDVMECIANGWFALVHIDRFWRRSTKHYVEWIEYYLEDGARTPHQPQGIMELAHGQQNLLGPS